MADLYLLHELKVIIFKLLDVQLQIVHFHTIHDRRVLVFLENAHRLSSAQPVVQLLLLKFAVEIVLLQKVHLLLIFHELFVLLVYCAPALQNGLEKVFKLFEHGEEELVQASLILGLVLSVDGHDFLQVIPELRGTQYQVLFVKLTLLEIRDKDSQILQNVSFDHLHRFAQGTLYLLVGLVRLELHILLGGPSALLHSLRQKFVVFLDFLDLDLCIQVRLLQLLVLLLDQLILLRDLVLVLLDFCFLPCNSRLQFLHSGRQV